MKRSITLALGLLLCSGLLTGSAYATTITFNGLAGQNDVSVISLFDISGTDIPIQSVTISDAPNASYDNTYLVTHGLLNFAFSGSENYININGNIPLLLGLGSSPEDLLQGTFTLALGTPGDPTITLGIGFDQKAADLLEIIGLPTDTQFSFAELTLSQDPNDESHAYTAATVINRTPEPSSLLLLGAGLLGLGLLGRKKLQSVKV